MNKKKWWNGVYRSPVEHFQYIMRQRNVRAYGHHEFKRGTRSGAHACGICGRWVVRGMGRWWELNQS